MTRRAGTTSRCFYSVHRAGAIAVVCCLGFGRLAFPADAPATQPADNALTVGSADPVVEGKPELVAKWFSQLDDADPTVRDDAYNKLLSLKSSDLDTLKDVVKKSMPLHPTQVTVLPEIVKQIYLSGMDYDGEANAGFMGVSLLDRDNAQFGPVPQEGQVQHTGVMISHCMVGFGGARSLRDGDVILGIIERPEVKIDTIPNLANTVAKFGAGAVIHLSVLRNDRVIHVAVTLDARPAELDGPGIDQAMALQELQKRREDAAADYWAHDFAPLFKSGAS